MCAACVAQGVAYVGGAVAGLQVLAARARGRRSPASPQAGNDHDEHNDHGDHNDHDDHDERTGALAGATSVPLSSDR
jgi:hypothetical protein